MTRKHTSCSTGDSDGDGDGDGDGNGYDDGDGEWTGELREKEVQYLSFSQREKVLLLFRGVIMHTVLKG